MAGKRRHQTTWTISSTSEKSHSRPPQTMRRPKLMNTWRYSGDQLYQTSARPRTMPTTSSQIAVPASWRPTLPAKGSPRPSRHSSQMQSNGPAPATFTQARCAAINTTIIASGTGPPNMARVGQRQTICPFYEPARHRPRKGRSPRHPYLGCRMPEETIEAERALAGFACNRNAQRTK